MKLARFPLIIFVIAAMIVGVLWFSPRSQIFSTPDECIQTFYDAAKKADAEKYLGCLDTSLRTALRKQYSDNSQLEEYLKSTTKQIMNWAQMGKTEFNGSTATIHMIETRKNSSAKITYRLRQNSGGWRIVTMNAPKKLQTILPYGVHEKEVWKNK